MCVSCWFCSFLLFDERETGEDTRKEDDEEIPETKKKDLVGNKRE